MFFINEYYVFNFFDRIINNGRHFYKLLSLSTSKKFNVAFVHSGLLKTKLFYCVSEWEINGNLKNLKREYAFLCMISHEL